MAVLEGTVVAAALRGELTAAVGSLAGRRPRLDVVLVGDDAPSAIYVAGKQRACHEVGILSHLHRFNAHCTEAQLLAVLADLNADPAVDGILVQLPLPAHIDTKKAMEAIDPSKDVDGFHPINRGKLCMGDPTAFVPCTPLGVCELFKYYRISTAGKRVTIVGRSNIVGKPLAMLLMQQAPWGNATVTVAHSYTPDLVEVCSQADILIAAIGKPHTIGPHMVKEGAIVVDVGMTAHGDAQPGRKRRVLGDVDFAAVHHKCQWITPVPGGVGPMTIAMLLANTWESYRRRQSLISLADA